MKKPEKRVFVVDDDPAVRTSLSNLLEAENYAVETFANATAYLAHEPHLAPCCLVLDIGLPDMDGFSLQQQLVKRGSSESIVFITGHGDISMGVGAMKRGAVDFLAKPFDDVALLNAVEQAIARSADHWREHGEVVKIRAQIATLTPREFEAFRLVIAGLLNKQIAAELGAAVRTIKTHRSRVMHKLGVISVAELVRLAQKAGIAPAPHS